MKSLSVIDLKCTPDAMWVKKFQQFIENLRLNPQKDPLIKNYLDLDSTWQLYDTFNLVTNGAHILAFSGMHTSPYPIEISRVLSRLYYTESLRIKNLAGHQLPSFASKLMLPYQVQKAQELKKKAIFLSFQGLKRRHFCYRLADVLTNTYKQNWYVHDCLLNTVRPLPNGNLNNHHSAWQNCIVLEFDSNYDINLPKMTITDWEKKYLVTLQDSDF